MRSRVINGIFGIYHYILSPALHTLSGSLQGCRFTPSCSEYGRQSLLHYGFIQGMKLTLKRIARCQPFSKGGFDPVPLSKTSSHNHQEPNLERTKHSS